MATLFLFGSVFFWVLISLAILLILISTEMEESNSWGWLIVMVTLALLYVGGNRELLTNGLLYIKDNPGVILIILLIYIVVGVVWSFIKWYFFLLGLKDKIHSWTNIDSYTKCKFEASYNKERIINWMIYWPISAIWTLINQPIRKIFNRIYTGVEKQFQRISDNVTDGFKK